jgi:hypothetical protein
LIEFSFRNRYKKAVRGGPLPGSLLRLDAETALFGAVRFLLNFAISREKPESYDRFF